MTTGYRTASTLAQRCLHAWHEHDAHHVAHAQCTLGIAAYWFEILLTAPELNDQNVGYLRERVDEAVVGGTVSRRGGISGKQREPDERERGRDRRACCGSAGSRR